MGCVGYPPVAQERYAEEPFVKLLRPGEIPQTHYVRGSNYNHINVFQDRIKGRAIVLSGRAEQGGAQWFRNWAPSR